MENRCDSVDALMYAYYAFMKRKEENQMLEKNKDYVEFTLQYTSVDWERRKDCPEVCLKGYSDFSFPGVPIMDVVCNEFDHKVVVVSKRDFEQLQADNQHYRELAKQREEDYKALLDKTGFYNLADLMCYLPKDKTLKGIIDGLAAENEGLIKKLQESDPFAENKELLEKLYSTDDVEKLEWTLNHICGGQASANGWMVTAKLWRRNYETLSKLIGFSSVEEIQDYLVNEAECDTLHEAISKLHDEVKYTSDKWASANRSNNSWKAAAECNSPKELIEKLNLLRDDIAGRSTVIESYKRDIEKWQKATGCKTPEEAKNWANELGEANGSLAHAVLSWNTVTGCSCPRDLSKKIVELEKILTPHMSARDLCSAISNVIESYKRSIEKWQKATGYSTPEEVKEFIEGLREEIGIYSRALNEWKEGTGCPGPSAAKILKEKLTEEIEAWKNATGYSTPDEYVGGWQKIRCLCEGIYKSNGDYDNLLKLTGYKSEDHIHTLLQDGERQHYQTLRDLINSIKRHSQFTESNWKEATRCNTPEEASKKLKYYENRLASYAIRHLDNIVFRDDKRTDWSDK